MPAKRQAIIWANDGILLIRTLGRNFSEICTEGHTFSFQKIHLKISSAKWRLFRLDLNVLTHLVDHLALSLYKVVIEHDGTIQICSIYAWNSSFLVLKSLLPSTEFPGIFITEKPLMTSTCLKIIHMVNDVRASGVTGWIDYFNST